MDRRSLCTFIDFYRREPSRKRSSNDSYRKKVFKCFESSFTRKTFSGLQGLVNKNGKAAASALSAEDLRNLFCYHESTLSDTLESMCLSPQNEEESETGPIVFKEQVGVLSLGASSTFLIEREASRRRFGELESSS